MCFVFICLLAARFCFAVFFRGGGDGFVHFPRSVVCDLLDCIWGGGRVIRKVC